MLVSVARISSLVGGMLADKTFELFRAASEIRWVGPQAEGEREGGDGNPIVANSIRAEQRRSTLMLQDHRW